MPNGHCILSGMIKIRVMYVFKFVLVFLFGNSDDYSIYIYLLKLCDLLMHNKVLNTPKE